jgi:endonuclease YncB( thermonuclease family)
VIFKRGTSWLALIFLGALLAACAYVAGQRVVVERPRTQAAMELAAQPMPVPVQIDHIVDGDTFRIFVVLTSGERVSAPVRIRGFDAPELHGACDGEIRRAREASRALVELLRSGAVVMDQIGSDKYERVLARVFVRRNGTLLNVAEVMVGEGHGRPYEGRKRAGWC